MHPLSPLFGVAILAGVLTANYLRTAWRLGLLRALGSPGPLRQRTLAANCIAAVLPLIGAVVAFSLVPTGDTGEIRSTAFQLAAHIALCGLIMHEANDAIIRWGAPRRR
jgi:hypothetical protein